MSIRSTITISQLIDCNTDKAVDTIEMKKIKHEDKCKYRCVVLAFPSREPKMHRMKTSINQQKENKKK